MNRTARPSHRYPVRRAAAPPPLEADWNGVYWSGAETLEVGCFRPEGSPHRPRTFARLLHDDAGIHGIYRVEDRYVRCTRTRYHDPVWRDACVEVFLHPASSRGYFNFEFNCGGAFLSSYITDPARVPDGFKEFVKVPPEIGGKIRVRSTLPPVVEPEIGGPVDWSLQFYIPFAVMEAFAGPLGRVGGQQWRGNFFKCAEDNSHPHWASWSPVDEFNFHLPRCFGEICFED